ncbi:MAG: RidA family protein [Eubacteriaceae bacterium]|jgi:2-iminobutanoate/2-iminopropanoate deaminase|nr:RidA family protein [Eubacteriaceae bacterium]
MKKIIDTPNAPKAVGPYSQAVDTGNMLFVSGQLGLDPATGALVSEEVSEQAKQVLSNVQAIVEAAGYKMENIVKATVFLADINDFIPVNRIYKTYFTNEYPARAAYQVGSLPLGGKVEMEVIAVK